MSENELTIGDIIKADKNLTKEQVEHILNYQQQHDLRFGEAAVALGYINRDDVLWALSQQFHYPYAGQTSNNGIPEELAVAKHPFSETAEVFRDLRSQVLEVIEHDAGTKAATAIVSAESGDGKTFVASNLAVAFSQLGGRTLLVDANLRNPTVHEAFGVKGASGGVSSILSGRAETNVIRPIEQIPNLYIMPVGVIPPNPTELLQRPALKLLLKELQARFDYVIVDTPPFCTGVDAKIIASACGNAIVVGRKNMSNLTAMKKLVSDLKRTNTNIIGITINHGK